MKPAFVTLAIALIAFSQTQAQEPEGRKVLDRFVGEWNAEATDKPAKFLPDGAKRSVKQTIGPIVIERPKPATSGRLKTSHL